MTPPNHYNRNLTILASVFVTMLITSLVWVGVGAVAYKLLFSDPPQFEVTVDQPETVIVGDKFSIKIHVLNDSANSLTVGNIDLYQDLLDGFEILDYQPKPKSQDNYWDYKSCNFGRKLKASETFVFTLELRAKEEGDWAGDIDVCTPIQNLITTYTSITVEPATPPKGAGMSVEDSE